jgi:hypothetical protein
MHPPEIKQAALALIAAGHNDCEVSRRLGVPRPTIREWRRPIYVPKRTIPLGTCPRCWARARSIRFTPEDYAELLAIYLGDGSISTYPRTQRLRVVLDRKYPGIISDVEGLLGRCFPENEVDRVPAIGCFHVSVYSSHLVCLFPQHGPGPKHERPIVLEPWQRKLVDQAPWPFIRGCIRTDGCAFINRTDVHRDVPYEYLSYGFSNKSKDIVDLLVQSCDQVGVFTRVNCSAKGQWDVRINRRSSVALMLEHVGRKT